MDGAGWFAVRGFAALCAFLCTAVIFSPYILWMLLMPLVLPPLWLRYLCQKPALFAGTCFLFPMHSTFCVRVQRRLLLSCIFFTFFVYFSVFCRRIS